MSDLHVVDSTWIGLPPSALADAVAEPAAWRRWWPTLRLTATALRGDKGVRWTVASAPHGGTGSAELWLQAELDGTVAHWILRLDFPSASGPGARERAALELALRAETKQALWGLADELDPGRYARLTTVAPLPPDVAGPDPGRRSR